MNSREARKEYIMFIWAATISFDLREFLLHLRRVRLSFSDRFVLHGYPDHLEPNPRSVTRSNNTTIQEVLQPVINACNCIYCQRLLNYIEESRPNVSWMTLLRSSIFALVSDFMYDVDPYLGCNPNDIYVDIFLNNDDDDE